MSELVKKLMAIHDSLTEAGLAHAFGGAIALAYCIKEPRGTRDLDVNIFTDSSNAAKALSALPSKISVKQADIKITRRDGQTRLWWDDTPVDVFLNNHPLHDAAAAGVMWVPLSGRDIPVLDCTSLVVFKALFNRTKDWADIEAISDTGATHIDNAASLISQLVGTDDPIYNRLISLQR